MPSGDRSAGVARRSPALWPTPYRRCRLRLSTLTPPLQIPWPGRERSRPLLQRETQPGSSAPPGSSRLRAQARDVVYGRRASARAGGEVGTAHPLRMGGQVASADRVLLRRIAQQLLADPGLEPPRHQRLLRALPRAAFFETRLRLCTRCLRIGIAAAIAAMGSGPPPCGPIGPGPVDVGDGAIGPIEGGTIIAMVRPPAAQRSRAP